MKMVRTNMKMVNTKFKTGGLHEKHVVATWNLGNHLSINKGYFVGRHRKSGTNGDNI